MSTWKANPDLMARLTKAQNHPVNINADIVSFAGFCDSRAELERHVVRYERAVIHAEGVDAVAGFVNSLVEAAFRQRHAALPADPAPV